MAYIHDLISCSSFVWDRRYSASLLSNDTTSSAGDSEVNAHLVDSASNVDLPNKCYRQSGFEADAGASNLKNESNNHSFERLVQLEPGHVEERFKVDRKKLESMLHVRVQAPYDVEDGSLESGEDFFQRIMDETDTTISWPSRLKIGAKSKKDPHIKVTGKPEKVASAKNKIMSILDTKGNRVTLKMDVSFTEHSHIIGKGGNSIRGVMEASGCHIHFPDSNRCKQQEKSNQVSIAGQLLGAEQARAKIRELLPLVMLFEVPPRLGTAVPDMNSPAVQHVVQTCNVAVSMKQKNGGYATMVTVRGSASNPLGVNEACIKLMEHLNGNPGVSLPVSTQIEIAPQHHQFMLARGGFNINQIMQCTRTVIRFPDPSTTLRKSSVFITGSVGSVIVARELLMGCLPLVLMFDVREDTDVSPPNLTRIMEQFDVFISVKPKPKQPNKSVIVKSVERNAANMYRARLQLLDQDECDDLSDDKTGIPNSHPLTTVGMLPVVMHHSMSGVLLQPQTIRPLLFPQTGATKVQPSTTLIANPPMTNINANTHRVPPTISMAPPSPSPATLVYTVPKNSPLPQPAHTTPHIVNLAANGNPPAQWMSLNPHHTMVHQSNQSPGSGTLQVSPMFEQRTTSWAMCPPEYHGEVTSNSQPACCFPPNGGMTQKPVTIPNCQSPEWRSFYGGMPSPPPDIMKPANQQQPSVAGQTPATVTLSPCGPSPENRSPYDGVPPPRKVSPLHHSPGNYKEGGSLMVRMVDDQPPSRYVPGEAPLEQSSVVPSDARTMPRMTDYDGPRITQSSFPPEPNLSCLTFLTEGVTKGTGAPFNTSRPDGMGGRVVDTPQKLSSPSHEQDQILQQDCVGQTLTENTTRQASMTEEPPSRLPAPPPGFSTPNPSMVSSQLAELQLSSPVNKEHSSSIERILRRSSTSESFSPDMSDMTLSHVIGGAMHHSSGNLSSQDVSPDSSGSFSTSSGDQLSPGSSGHFSPMNSGHFASSRHPLQHNGAQLSTDDQLAQLLGNRCPSAMSQGSSESEMDSDSSDKRAPGWERAGGRHRGMKNLETDVVSLDYGQKKLLAQKAMKNLPVTKEVRTPIDTWSGLGFSKSMPDSKFLNLRRRDGFSACLPSTYEHNEVDEEATNQHWPNHGRENQINHAVSTNLNKHPRRPAESILSCSNYIDSTTLPRPARGLWTQGNNSTMASAEEDLSELFVDLGLGKYTDVFQQQEIDLATFLTLTDSDLKELGVSTFGARRRMLLAISDLNNNRRTSLKNPLTVGGQNASAALGCLVDGQFTSMGRSSPVSCW